MTEKSGGVHAQAGTDVLLHRGVRLVRPLAERLDQRLVRLVDRRGCAVVAQESPNMASPRAPCQTSSKRSSITGLSSTSTNARCTVRLAW